MYIHDDLSFFFPESRIEVALNTSTSVSCDVTVNAQKCKAMQSSLHEKGTVNRPGAWAPVMGIGDEGRGQARR
jgi:hypothetical protein